MEKYLVDIEFRYSDAPRYEDDYTSRTKKATIGVYDNFNEACVAGNNLLENLESKFKLHKFPDGTSANKSRFSKNGGCFGSKNDLVTNLAYLKTPFSFYAQIKTLKYLPINETIQDVVNSCKNYKKYDRKNN